MLEYDQLFKDYLQLRAFISDTSSSLEDEAELDILKSITRNIQRSLIE